MSFRWRWLIAAICVLAIVIAAVFAWGLVRDGRDESEAAEVVERFRNAVNAGDFETACGLLASTAPMRAVGGADCPSRLRNRKDMVAQWAYILPGDLEADIYERDDGRVRAIVHEKALTIFDAGPIYRFTFVVESGGLRLEHHQGRF